MKIKYKQISAGAIIVIIALFHTQCNLFDNNIDKNSNTSNVQQSNELIPVKSFKSCENEKAFLVNLTQKLKGNNQLLKQKHKTLKNEQMEWDVFIANYNKRAKLVQDTMKTVKFNCFAQYSVDNMITSFVMIGFYYRDGPTEKSRFYENKFEEFRLTILNEIKKNK